MKNFWFNQQCYLTFIHPIAFVILILLFPRLTFAGKVEKSKYLALETEELEISPLFSETLFSKLLISKDFLIDLSLSLNTYSTNDIAQTNTSSFGLSANTVVFRPVIPFKLGDTNNILRITAPIITSNPVYDLV